MAKIILAFALLMMTYAVGIKTFRKLTNKERWSLLKTMGFAFGSAILSVITLVIIVTLF